MDPDFAELLAQEVTLERYTGTDGFGNRTFATAATVNVRIENQARTMAEAADPTTEKLPPAPKVSATLIAATRSPQWAVRDKVTLPDDTVVYIRSVEPAYDETAEVHHVTIEAEEGWST